MLTDARSGTAHQALGVAEALAIPFAVKLLKYTTLVQSLNVARSVTGYTLTAESRATLLGPPWPDILITAGRRAALVARWIRAQASQTSLAIPPFLAQIMFPGWRGLADFDLVAVPNHDRLFQMPSNVIHITGAPHRFTPTSLAMAADYWRTRFDNSLPRPRVACLVGGASSRWRPFTADLACTLAARTAALTAASGGSVLLTTSRRTEPSAAAALLSVFADSGVPLFAYLWGDLRENPYPGLLALADSIVVTGDSVSMCTEACAQPGPVFIFAPPGWVRIKHARLHTELFALGYARPLPYAEDRVFPDWRHLPLNPARVVADKIRMCWRLRNQSHEPV
ncbi:DUF1022 domain-containing protein [invertebrate metagenome]|uniref:DUF1022 domain-containing protein n=1 Tax=invertebrate metagenome TaxID=1711999 RepID=A0A484H5N6_9ZZZZ